MEAANGENYEHTVMYPGFIEQAKKENNNAAIRSFTYANEVEKVHEDYYRSALSSVIDKKDLPAKKLFICPVCGNIEEGEAPERCSIAGLLEVRSARSIKPGPRWPFICLFQLPYNKEP